MNTSGQIHENVPHDRPNPARIYDYLLGGYHNFEIDRMAAQKLIEINPDTPLVMRANRAFLRRAVNFLVEQGIDQFLDIGSGIPTVGNVHEAAQKANPEARVVYVDFEPVAVHHSETLLKNNPNATVIQADLRQPEVILDHPEVRRLLDLDRPVALLVVSVLLFIPDEEEAYRSIHTLRDALAPGSYLAISHATYEGVQSEVTERVKKLYAGTPNPVAMRSHAQIERFFEGFELVEPGLVYVPLWRPEGPGDIFLDRPEMASNYSGVGRKP